LIYQHIRIFAMKKRGKLFLVSAPSGAGKTTLVQQVIKQIGPEYGLEKVITYTTKEPRPGEVNGKDYHFLSELDFKKRLAEGFFVEHSTAYGAYYGFPLEVFSFLETGRSFMGIVDLAGAEAIRAHTDEAILIGIRPPSVASLEERLIGRAEDSDQTIQFRLSIARHELERISEGFFNHVMVNDDFERAVRALVAIVRDELAK
jgi:guanylate kinase